jgi:hypothetical protein
MTIQDKVFKQGMKSPQISYFDVSPIDDEAALQAIKDEVAEEIRTRIENTIGKTSIRFTFRNLSEHPRGPIRTNRWEARADFYSAKMESPQIGYFEVSTIDSIATLQAMKAKVAAKMRARIENQTGKLEISFTFRNLSELNSRLGGNNRWEVRADF